MDSLNYLQFINHLEEFNYTQAADYKNRFITTPLTPPIEIFKEAIAYLDNFSDSTFDFNQSVSLPQSSNVSEKNAPLNENIEHIKSLAKDILVRYDASLNSLTGYLTSLWGTTQHDFKETHKLYFTLTDKLNAIEQLLSIQEQSPSPPDTLLKIGEFIWPVHLNILGKFSDRIKDYLEDNPQIDQTLIEIPKIELELSQESFTHVLKFLYCVENKQVYEGPDNWSKKTTANFILALDYLGIDLDKVLAFCDPDFLKELADLHLKFEPEVRIDNNTLNSIEYNQNKAFTKALINSVIFYLADLKSDRLFPHTKALKILIQTDPLFKNVQSDLAKNKEWSNIFLYNRQERLVMAIASSFFKSR